MSAGELIQWRAFFVWLEAEMELQRKTAAMRAGLPGAG